MLKTKFAFEIEKSQQPWCEQKSQRKRYQPDISRTMQLGLTTSTQCKKNMLYRMTPGTEREFPT